MSSASNARSDEFLRISDQFKLGTLVTESPHPVTQRLDQTARADVTAALDLLFQVDEDVLAAYQRFVDSGRALAIQESVLAALRGGGRLFFTGCGATGRLSIQLVAIWRDFWQQLQLCQPNPAWQDLEQRALAVMAGGDFALIKSVEGFEDYASFGRKQMTDLGVAAGDVVFAITEGGETSFVIGTAWQGVDAGAKVYFVYNNPDDILVEHIQRSREVILDPRIEKINLTTGPMAIAGSTRMQATTIQLCVLTTVLEMVVRELSPASAANQSVDSAAVPAIFLAGLKEMHAALRSSALLKKLAALVELEEDVYRKGHRNSYYADRFGIDVLTDTTERSPTYCTPPFRKFDDTSAAESWSFLFVPCATTRAAWERLLRRPPRCIEWTEPEVRQLVGEDKAAQTLDTLRKIGEPELLRFRVGLDGLPSRVLGPGDSATAIVSESERESLLAEHGFFRTQLEAARKAGVRTGVIYAGKPELFAEVRAQLLVWNPDCRIVLLPAPATGLLLDSVTRAGIKMLLNTLSTCTMVRLGRVMGNHMIWVVTSNLKLIDRATRYVRQLTGLDYASANRLLFEVVEYIEPRMRADQAYPPAVAMAVARARHHLTNEQAELRLTQ